MPYCFLLLTAHPWLAELSALQPDFLPGLGAQRLPTKLSVWPHFSDATAPLTVAM